MLLEPSIAMPAEAPPAAYELVYRLEDTTQPVADITTARIRVRRPFESHVVLMKGPPPGGRVTVERKARLGELGLINVTSGQRQILQVPPAAASSDLRPDISLADAESEGVIERREQRKVAGLRCQVWRLGTSVSAGELLPVGARTGEYADACFDARGLLLEEIWVLDDRRVRRRIATSIDVTPTFTPEEFLLEGATSVPEAEGGGSVRPADPDNNPSGLFVIDALPPGFTRLGRYAVKAPKIDPGTNPLTEIEQPRTVSITDVWVRGPDMIILDQGEGNPFDPNPAAESIDVHPVGKGTALLDLRSNELRFQSASGYLRLFGTVGKSTLLEVATHVRQIP